MKKFALLLVAAAVVSIPCFSQVERLDGGLDAKTTTLKLDHFFCYIISSETTQAAVNATLTDQFQTASVTVGTPLQFCNPVQKTIGTVVTPIVDINDHLTMYHLETAASLPTSQTLTATNQFGAQQFTVDSATSLMVPTQKGTLSFPTRLDHYLCYPVSGTSLALTASLADQFQSVDVTVGKPELFCNPVQKTIGTVKTRIQNRAAHLVCYGVSFPQSTTSTDVHIMNQIETDTFKLTTNTMLCVPSTKTLPGH